MILIVIVVYQNSMKFGMVNLKALHLLSVSPLLSQSTNSGATDMDLTPCALSGMAGFRAALLAGCFQAPGLAHETTVRVSEGLS